MTVLMSRSKLCSIADESVFGPRVAPSCLNGFDFTLLFEESILTIVPVAIVCLLLPIRVWTLQHVPVKVNQSWLHAAKLVALSLYVVLQLVLLALWSGTDAPTTTATIPTAAVTAVAFTAFLYVSHLEHLRSLRPSTILTLYLGFSLLFDVARARTLWFTAGSQVIAAVFSAECGVKAVILVLEATEKRSLLKNLYQNSADEALGGIYSRSFFWWLNSFLWTGFKTLLTVDNLSALDDDLIAASDPRSLVDKWKRADKSRSQSLLWTFLMHYKWHILAGVVPRLVYTGLTFAQPFLVQRVLDFMTEPEDVNSDNKAYGLIGAYAIVYLGLAVSLALYEHKTYRAITMIRGSLVTMVFDKTLRIHCSAVSDAAAITHMSADVERIGNGLVEMHELYSSIIEMGIGLWLLTRLLHVATAASTVFVAICLIMGMPLAVAAGNAQGTWLEAIEKRISVTSKVLGAMKSIRMTGMASSVSANIDSLRRQEIKSSRIFRSYDVLVVVMSYASSALTPVFGFGLYILLARAHGTTTLTDSIAFSALTLFTLLERPIVSLVHGVEQLMTVVNGFQRIQKYLLEEESVDYRLTPSLNSEQTETPSSGSLGPSDCSSIDHDKTQRFSSCALLQDVSGGWSGETKLCLHNLSLEIADGEITIISGPVGCGKSTFLKLLLGEIPYTSGYLLTSFSRAAYCSQSPWMIFGTIRENIVGASPWNRSWYDRVIQACALDVDLQDLPDGDQTRVGARGSRLSGGQQMRVTLARSLYSKEEVLILDDVLSGLDQATERHILQHVFGPDGMLKQARRTVVMVTSSAHHLPYADSIVVFDADGTIFEQGSYKDLAATSSYVNDLDRGIQVSEIVQVPEVVLNDDILQDLAFNEHMLSANRQAGDWTVYKYYFQNVGWILTGLYMACSSAFVFGLNFPQIWLQWWTEANENQPNARIGYWLGIFAALGVLNLALAALCDGLFTLVIVPKTARQFHNILLHTTMRATTAFLTTTDVGTTLNRFSQDLELIDMELPSTFDLTVTAFLSCIVEGVLVFVGSSSYVALAIPGCIIVMYLIAKFYLRTSRQVRFLDIEAKAPLHSQFLEVLSGLPSIRAYGWAEDYKRRNKIALNTSQRPYYLLFCIQRWLNLVLDLLVAGVSVLVVSLATLLRGKASTNFLGVALFNIVSFSGSLQQLIAEWTRLEMAIGAVSRIRSFEQHTQLEDLDKWQESVVDDWPKEGGISFDKVSASHDMNAETSVLKDIELEISPGDKIAVCGRTGSGKSSLVLALLRMLELNTGTILIDGVDISKISQSYVRTRLNIVPQDTFFLHGSVRFNIDPTGKANDDAIIIQSLRTVRLWEYIESKGGLDVEMSDDLLSHGQRQLFCLARSLCSSSSIVIMDEVTSSVDLETEDLIYDIIRSKFQHKTVICIMHKLRSIMDFDKVAVMDTGRLVEFGTPRSLLTKEGSAFKELYENGVVLKY